MTIVYRESMGRTFSQSRRRAKLGVSRKLLLFKAHFSCEDERIQDGDGDDDEPHGRPPPFLAFSNMLRDNVGLERHAACPELNSHIAAPATPFIAMKTCSRQLIP